MCSIDDVVLQKLKKFRFRKDKTNAAIVSELTILKEEGVSFFFFFLILSVKIDMESVTVMLDDSFDEEELQVKIKYSTPVSLTRVRMQYYHEYM